jgi:hypothetical protein
MAWCSCRTSGRRGPRRCRRPPPRSPGLLRRMHTVAPSRPLTGPRSGTALPGRSSGLPRHNSLGETPCDGGSQWRPCGGRASCRRRWCNSRCPSCLAGRRFRRTVYGQPTWISSQIRQPSRRLPRLRKSHRVVIQLRRALRRVQTAEHGLRPVCSE